MTTTVLETCGILPRPGAAADLSLPLSFFDMAWLHANPIRRQLIFYEHPCSEADFSNTIVPNLKHSLSLTLKHYLPLAANLLYPLNTHDSSYMPLFRYVSGDTVKLTIAVSGSNFDELAANHARDSDQFYAFTPPMPPLTEEENYKIAPLFALQATLFPGRGICIGFKFHHSLGDARSIVGFMSAWAEINRSGDDEAFVSKNGESLPIFERSIFGDCCTRFDGIFWKLQKNIPLKLATSHPLQTNRVRASFILTQSDIKKLKNLVSSTRVSSFVVTAAYVWTAWVKSFDAAGDEVEVLAFPADGRVRPNALFDPPVPTNYFGNCFSVAVVSVERRKLVAEDGFVVAAEAIAAEIKTKINDGNEFMKSLEKLLWEEMQKLLGMRSLVVSGSPKFELSEADFGWGKARKVEVMSLDGDSYSMSLGNSGGGGLVVGMSLPKETMEAFAALFEDGLKNL